MTEWDNETKGMATDGLLAVDRMMEQLNIPLEDRGGVQTNVFMVQLIKFMVHRVRAKEHKSWLKHLCEGVLMNLEHNKEQIAKAQVE